ncbi:MAG: hypothetical protein V9G25_01360 [Acidimicrobiia bacterium]
MVKARLIDRLSTFFGTGQETGSDGSKVDMSRRGVLGLTSKPFAGVFARPITPASIVKVPIKPVPIVEVPIEPVDVVPVLVEEPKSVKISLPEVDGPRLQSSVSTRDLIKDALVKRAQIFPASRDDGYIDSLLKMKMITELNSMDMEGHKTYFHQYVDAMSVTLERFTEFRELIFAEGQQEKFQKASDETANAIIDGIEQEFAYLTQEIDRAFLSLSKVALYLGAFDKYNPRMQGDDIKVNEFIKELAEIPDNFAKLEVEYKKDKEEFARKFQNLLASRNPVTTQPLNPETGIPVSLNSLSGIPIDPTDVADTGIMLLDPIIIGGEFFNIDVNSAAATQPKETHETILGHYRNTIEKCFNAIEGNSDVDVITSNLQKINSLIGEARILADEVRQYPQYVNDRYMGAFIDGYENQLNKFESQASGIIAEVSTPSKTAVSDTERPFVDYPREDHEGVLGGFRKKIEECFNAIEGNSDVDVITSNLQKINSLIGEARILADEVRQYPQYVNDRHMGAFIDGYENRLNEFESQAKALTKRQGPITWFKDRYRKDPLFRRAVRAGVGAFVVGIVLSIVGKGDNTPSLRDEIKSTTPRLGETNVSTVPKTIPKAELPNETGDLSSGADNNGKPKTEVQQASGDPKLDTIVLTSSANGKTKTTFVQTPTADTPAVGSPNPWAVGSSAAPTLSL